MLLTESILYYVNFCIVKNNSIAYKIHSILWLTKNQHFKAIWKFYFMIIISNLAIPSLKIILLNYWRQWADIYLDHSNQRISLNHLDNSSPAIITITDDLYIGSFYFFAIKVNTCFSTGTFVMCFFGDNYAKYIGLFYLWRIFWIDCATNLNILIIAIVRALTYSNKNSFKLLGKFWIKRFWYNTN